MNNPYYIVASHYTRISGGIKNLYQLCHNLNTKGYKAFIIDIQEPYILNKISQEEYNKRFYNLNTPRLSYQDFTYHITMGFNPILIYPETIYNLKEFKHLPCTIRYIMHYIGYFPESPTKDDSEFKNLQQEQKWAFSKNLADVENIDETNVLFYLNLEYDIFYPIKKMTQRNGKLCYLGKYYDNYTKELPKEIDASFDVFYRSHPVKSPNQQEYAEKMRNAELIYIYEDTGVMWEALLCECPVVLMPNKYFKATLESTIGLKDIGIDGIAFGDSPEEINRAKSTVSLARQKIIDNYKNYNKSLDVFIIKTQTLSNKLEMLPQCHKVKIIKNGAKFFLRELQYQTQNSIFTKLRMLLLPKIWILYNSPKIFYLFKIYNLKGIVKIIYKRLSKKFFNPSG